MDPPRLRPSGSAPAADRPAPPHPGEGSWREERTPVLEISVGRVVVERPTPPPAPAAAPQGGGPTRGFAGFSAARRGFLR